MSSVPVAERIDPAETQSHTLLPLLLEYQRANEWNYISEEDVREIAVMLKLSRSRVYSTASYYSEISLKPRGRHLIRVCGNAPCENAGKDEVLNAIRQELDISIDETTEDRMFTLESVNCLGACYMSPAMKIDDRVYGNLTASEVVGILRTVRMEDGNDD